MRTDGETTHGTDIILLEDERGYIELCEVDRAGSGPRARMLAAKPPVRWPHGSASTPEVDEAAQTGVFLRLSLPTVGDVKGPWTPLPWQPHRR